MSASSTPRLTRDKEDGMLGGICAGLAARYGYDVGLVRLVWVLLTLLTSGVGIIIYIAAWAILPVAGAATPASMGERRREFSDEVSAAAERAAEAARIAAAHARQAADEISAVARGVSQPAAPAPPTTPAPVAEPEASVPETEAGVQQQTPPQSPQ
ncbi:MAG: PspC domain-containing protein [Dehalococcoidia bacterium]|nr:MAG: PspC domain-containing protein [Dehalococcoidia bacterium]